MRIQNNIMAMNAYRNYTNNNSALSKNLEKLSSGYKINRAGDDAAGLAISEKMRAQITGLDVAQKNAQDGISLVQTAEGALTEVHDMLNRMAELASQSANGTYENEVDRENLQKEFAKLTEEIDRIADASNFNGINLLDGKLGASTVEGTAAAGTAPGTTTPATKAKYVFDFKDMTALTNGQTLEIAGKTITAQDGGDGTSAGQEINSTTANTLDAQLNAIVTALSSGGAQDITNSGADYTVKKEGTCIVIEAKTAGVDADASTIGADAKWATSNTVAKDAAKSVTGADEIPGATAGKAKTELDFTGKTAADFIGGSLTIGGTEYSFSTESDDGDNIKISENDDLTAILGKIKTKLTAGVQNADRDDFTVDVAGNKLVIEEETANSTDGNLTAAVEASFESSGATKGLKLQIGDTNDSYNQITVSIKSIKKGDLVDITEGTELALEDLSIRNAKDAGTAMQALKGMINYVSDIRGDLGATQNRLEHTINNLGVMEENIQNAESTIRDTDVAEEMMAYTKNNILIQSAQAMLAQANQVPQGVLQLLQ